MTEHNGFDYSNLVTWLLVVSGWLVVYQQNRHFQDRKELRATIDNLLTDINDLRNAAIKYHTEEASANQLLANDIKSRTNSLTSNIVDSLLETDEILDALTELRIRITFDNFESQQYRPQSHGSDLVILIYAATDDLRDLIDARFREMYNIGLVSRLSSLALSKFGLGQKNA